MNLKSYRVGNFKSFGPIPQEIPLKPLTLVFGPNSAGKSSIIHSLLWLNHMLETGEVDVVRPVAGEGKVDLGGFGQFLHRKESSREVIWGGSILRANLSEKFLSDWKCEKQLEFSVAIGRIGVAKHGLKSFEVMIDGRELLRFSRRGTDDRMKIDLLDFEHPALATRLALFGQTSIADMEEDELENLGMAKYRTEEIQNYLNLMVNSSCFEISAPKVFPEEMSRRARLRVDDIDDEDLFAQLSVLEREFPESLKAIVAGVIPSAFDLLFSELRKVTNTVLDTLEYLPPLRELPERSFERAKVEGSIWNLLVEDKEVREAVNQWLDSDIMKTRYRVGIRQLFPLASLSAFLPEALENEMAKLIENPSFLGELGNLMEELDHEFFNELDRGAYLQNHPDLYEELSEAFYSSNEDCWEDFGDDDWPLLSESEKRASARDSVDGTISDDGYFEDVWPHFIKHHPRLQQLLSTGDWNSVDSTEKILKKLQSEATGSRKELVLEQQPEKIEVSLQDVGVGISQILPVLISAMANRNRLIAIEQPEIHIHPALQAELGDLFIESALGERKISFLIETHSEHLILRILRRIRETTEEDLDGWPENLKKACSNGISPDDVAVLYVESGEDGATVRELRIDDHGEFRDQWPGGFFEERANEIF